jgi:cytochrome c peroxidase
MMKNITRKTFSGICLSLLLLLVQGFLKTTDPEGEIRSVILEQAGKFSISVHELQQAAGNYTTGKISAAALREQLRQTRLAYKGIEYLVEYYYPEHVKEHLNGPPLNHPDPYPHTSNSYYGMSAEDYLSSAPLDYLEERHFLDTPAVIAPRGLQVLDETVFGSAVYTDQQQVLQLATALEKQWAIVMRALSKRKYFQSFEITEAARLELVRIFSLGITGFDTPGSQNAVEEAREAVSALQQVTRPLLNQTTDSLRQYTASLFTGTIHYLAQHPGFATFDRLTFLTKYINPLYRTLLQAHQQLGLTSTQTLTGKTTSWNFYSTNLFAPDFLDPYYYSLLKKNKDSEALQRLGKKLFYDTRLSHAGTLSCGSCHKPEMAFTDGLKRSLAGVAGNTVQRNAPSLINSVFSDRYFYDLRAFDLEGQAGHVIRNHLEFDTDFPELLQKINADTAYNSAFNQVFNSQVPVTRYQFSSALASYVLSLRSFNSEFDQFVRGERHTISAEVRNGFNLFMGKAACGTCHYAPLFSGLVPPLYQENESEVLGVMESPSQRKIDSDKGRAANDIAREAISIYQHSFKTVSVRNAAITAPYFHNGAYATLSDVIDFYDQGGAAGAGLSYELPNQTMAADSLHLSKPEKKALIAFLRSLTDAEAIKKFSAK